MSPILVAAFFALLVALAALTVGFWYGLICRPMVKSSAAGRSFPLYTLWAIQFSAAVTTIALIYSGDGSAFWAFFFPFVLWPTAKQAAVMSHYHNAIWVGIAVGLAMIGGLTLISRCALRYALFPALLIAAIVTVHFTETRSQQRMAARAKELGANCLARHSFTESLKFWREDLQFDLHASAKISGAWYGWSYVEDDFYLIPDEAPKDGNGLQAQCAAEKLN